MKKEVLKRAKKEKSGSPGESHVRGRACGEISSDQARKRAT